MTNILYIYFFLFDCIVYFSKNNYKKEFKINQVCHFNGFVYVKMPKVYLKLKYLFKSGRGGGGGYEDWGSSEDTFVYGTFIRQTNVLTCLLVCQSLSRFVSALGSGCKMAGVAFIQNIQSAAGSAQESRLTAM